MGTILFGRTQDAWGTPFDNSSNGFAANQVQSAIEEARANPAARVSIVTAFNGTVGNNQWLGYNELLPGNLTPIRLPWACKMQEISLSFKGAAVDGRFEIYKNGFLAGNLIYSNTMTNQNGGKLITGLTLQFAANDYFSGKWVDLGDNPSDMAVTYFFILG